MGFYRFALADWFDVTQLVWHLDFDLGSYEWRLPELQWDVLQNIEAAPMEHKICKNVAKMMNNEAPWRFLGRF